MPFVIAPFEHVHSHLYAAVFHHAELPCGAFGKINDNAFGYVFIGGAAVYDADFYGAVILQVRYPDYRSQRVRRVGGYRFPAVKGFTAGGFFSVEARAVIRSQTGFRFFYLQRINPGRRGFFRRTTGMNEGAQKN